MEEVWKGKDRQKKGRIGRRREGKEERGRRGGEREGGEEKVSRFVAIYQKYMCILQSRHKK